MKPFDLEKAKAGEAVITRDGRDVRIVDFEYNNLLLYVITDFDKTKGAYAANTKGEWNKDSSICDLFMKPTKTTYHYCIYQNVALPRAVNVSTSFKDKEALIERYATSSKINILEYREIEVED